MKIPSTSAVIAALTLVCHATAQTSERAPEVPSFVSPAFDDRIFGDAYGHRATLANLGLDVDLLATIDFSASSGGLSDMQGGEYLLDLSLTFDLGQAKIIDGGTVFADLQYWNWFGDSPLSVGDYWGWDVINPAFGDEMFQLSELWWQQAIGDSGLTATVGKIDGARFFGVIPNAGPFLNASDCQPSTMLGTLPTYPNPSMAAILQWKLGANHEADPAADAKTSTTWLAQAGIFDGANAAYQPSTGSNGPRTGSRGPAGMFSDATYAIADFGPTWYAGSDAWRGNATVGGWMQFGQTLRTTSVASTVVENMSGVYLTLTQSLYGAGDSSTRFDLFSQSSWADPAKAQAQWSGNIGTICHAPFAARPRDSAGLLAGITLFSDDPLVFTAPNSTNSGGHESVFECFYRVQLANGVVLQPDLQWISTPSGGDPASLDAAFIATLHVEIAF